MYESKTQLSPPQKREPCLPSPARLTRLGDLERLTLVYFSPGGTTRKVLRHIAAGITSQRPREWNLTRPQHRAELAAAVADGTLDAQLWLVGVPVYAGRIPALARESLAYLQAHGEPAVTVVTYGNRDFGVALQELVALLAPRGFKVMGAAAFVGEHAFSPVFPMALARPDQRDLGVAQRFGKTLRAKSLSAPPLRASTIPGKLELLVRMLPDRGPHPVLAPELCTGCQACVKACPLGLIDPDTRTTKRVQARKTCLGCMTCVRRCRHGARSFSFPGPVKFLLRRFFSRAMTHRQEPTLLY